MTQVRDRNRAAQAAPKAELAPEPQIDMVGHPLELLTLPLALSRAHRVCPGDASCSRSTAIVLALRGGPRRAAALLDFIARGQRPPMASTGSSGGSSGTHALRGLHAPSTCSMCRGCSTLATTTSSICLEFEVAEMVEPEEKRSPNPSLKEEPEEEPKSRSRRSEPEVQPEEPPPEPQDQEGARATIPSRSRTPILRRPSAGTSPT